MQPRTDLNVQVALLPNILHAPITKRKLRDPTTLEANRKPKAIARSSARNSSRLWFALLWASQQRNSTRWSKHDLNTFTVYSGVYGKLLSLHRSVNVIFISLTKRLTGLESNNKTWFLNLNTNTSNLAKLKYPQRYLNWRYFSEAVLFYKLNIGIISLLIQRILRSRRPC